MIVELFFLPMNVSCGLLGSWLDLKSVVALDTAICSRARRVQLSGVLSAKELVHHNPVVVHGAKMAQWLCIKSLRISNLVFSAETERSHVLAQYFAFGDSVRRVHFCDGCNEMETMFLAACYCKNITLLRCTNVSLSYAFHVILRNKPNILEIWVHEATCVLEGLMEGLSLDKLQLLSVKDMPGCLMGFPWSESTHSNGLQCVKMDCTNYFIADMKVLTRNCSTLRSLAFENIHAVDTSLKTYISYRPEIINIKIIVNIIFIK